jgi:hypothetical protein
MNAKETYYSGMPERRLAWRGLFLCSPLDCLDSTHSGGAQSPQKRRQGDLMTAWQPVLGNIITNKLTMIEEHFYNDSKYVAI